MTIHVRRLGAADAASFSALRLRSLESAPDAFGSSPQEHGQLTLEEIAGRLERNAVFGAFDGDVLVGIVGVRRETSPKAAHRAFVWGLFVDEAHRRSGAARAMMAMVMAEAAAMPGVVQVELAVSSARADAQAFYASLGFTPIGTIPRALRVDGQDLDEILLLRRLDE